MSATAAADDRASAAAAPNASPVGKLLAARPEVGRVRGAVRRSVDGHAERDPEADLAELAPQDVGPVAGGGHPGAVDLGGRGERAAAPGDVLAQRPDAAGRVARVAGSASPCPRRRAARGRSSRRGPCRARVRRRPPAGACSRAAAGARARRGRGCAGTAAPRGPRGGCRRRGAASALGAGGGARPAVGRRAGGGDQQRARRDRERQEETACHLLWGRRRPRTRLSRRGAIWTPVRPAMIRGALGTWRSLVARLLWEQEAAGSNPAVPMTVPPCYSAESAPWSAEASSGTTTSAAVPLPVAAHS